MGFWSAAVAAKAAGSNVRCSPLYLLDLTSGPFGIWGGFGKLDFGGVTYLPARITAVPTLSQLVNGQAARARFGLSGVIPAGSDPGLAALTPSDRAKAKGRQIKVGFAAFDDDWHLLTAGPDFLWVGTMDAISAEQDGGNATTPATASIFVEAGTAFVVRKRATFALYSDRQQKRFSPTDRACERTGLYRFANKTWPIG